MPEKRNLILCTVVVLGLVNAAAAQMVIMQCDVGGCGPTQSGWVSIGSCGTFSNVAGTGIDVTLATGNPGACECRNPGGTGTLADVEADLLFANDEQSSPSADFIITFSNLTPGMSYRVLSYHNRSDEGDTTIPGVTITGATPISVPASIVQNHALMDNPAECIFTAGAGDVSIRYLAPEGGCPGCQAFLNGFVLEYVGPTISFESESSGAIESITPALINVNLTNPVGGATYTVDYAVTGGTAQGGGVDYSLEPDTLTFYPGQTTRTISIDIVGDELLEEDETIILELSNATGPDVMLGTAEHTYIISDLAPKVSFDSATSSGVESTTPALIEVKLSHATDQTVTVNYGVTGGTATAGTDYTVSGTMLTFLSGDVTEYISINVIDDIITEPQETIQLTLSSPINATLGVPAQHTYSILDNEQGVHWDGLIWYYSRSPTELYVTPDNRLVWEPDGGEQIITRLPDQPLSAVGNKVQMTYWWMTDGDHDCPDCYDCPDGCYDDSIECIAGTSDLRAGFFEADGEYITGDGYSVTGSSVFEGYKGYAWRFGPNMIAGPTRWVDCHDEVHKTGNFQKKSPGLDNLMYTNDGLTAYIPGFELPPGEWSLWTISLERTDGDTIRCSITLNGKTRWWEDDSGDDQPSKIDVFAFHMRNHRPYSIWTIATTEPTPVYPAYNPSPADGAQDVPGNTSLSWTPGEGATTHDVYLGTSYALVHDADTTSAAYRTTLNVPVNSYDPGGLQSATAYYWRIDESGGGTIRTGSVWNFTVADYIILDDMESYDEMDNRISYTWLDFPYPDWNNGGDVLLEQVIVHGGNQAMCFNYHNWLPYCTATRIYSGQNWASLGVDALALWFRADASNNANDQPYVLLRDGSGAAASVSYDGDPNDVTSEEWRAWGLDLDQFSGAGVDLTDIEEFVIGSAGTGAGYYYFDDIGLYATGCVPEYGPLADMTGDCMVDLKDFAVLADQWLGPPGTPSGDIAPSSPDGWVDGRDLAVMADQWLQLGLFPP